ncbi:hypothetical protein OA413_01720 [Pelagibacteraceae bacterium]|jgi:hypothetical protein|nr:hypothetical protein [Pelagibacteraceae bacterium]
MNNEIKNIIYFAVFTLIASLNLSFADSHVENCTITSGVFDKSEPIDNGYCASAPNAYEVVAYEMYLCTSAPTAPTTTSSMGLDNCFKNWEVSAGSTLSVQQNQTIDVPGTMSRPPNGTYTHGVMLIDNTFGITMAMQFDEAVTAQDGTSGIYCATVAGSGTYGSSNTIPTATSTCSASAITAGKFVEILTTFDSTFDATATADNLNGTSASITGYLIDSSGNLAENDADVDKLMGAISFASAVNFTDLTTTLTMSFNVGEGMAIYNNGSNRLVFGSGPFQAVITTD